MTAEDRTLNWLPLDHVVPLLTCHCADVIRGSEEVIRKALLHHQQEVKKNEFEFSVACDRVVGLFFSR